MNREPIFIIGHPKSGTSLMTALVDSHPQLLVLSEESDFYLNVWPLAETLNLEWRRSREEKVRLLLEHITHVSHIKNYFRGNVEEDISGNFDYRDFNHVKFKQGLNDRLLQFEKFTRKELLMEIMAAYQEAFRDKVKDAPVAPWVEKTAKNTWHIPSILEDFPKARFIFMYRDPRDNYVSFKKKLGPEMDAVKFAKSWNDSFEQAKRIHTDRLLVIKYEKLTREPQTHLRNVAQFLEIEYNDILVSPTKMGVAWKGNSMFGSESNSVSEANSGRYKAVIAQEDLKILEAFCSEQMKVLGYSLDTDPAQFGETRSRNQQKYQEWVPFAITHQKTLRKRLGEVRINVLGKKQRS